MASATSAAKAPTVTVEERQKIREDLWKLAHPDDDVHAQAVALERQLNGNGHFTDYQ